MKVEKIEVNGKNFFAAGLHDVVLIFPQDLVRYVDLRYVVPFPVEADLDIFGNLVFFKPSSTHKVYYLQSSKSLQPIHEGTVYSFGSHHFIVAPADLQILELQTPDGTMRIGPCGEVLSESNKLPQFTKCNLAQVAKLLNVPYMRIYKTLRKLERNRKVIFSKHNGQYWLSYSDIEMLKKELFRHNTIKTLF